MPHVVEIFETQNATVEWWSNGKATIDRNGERVTVYPGEIAALMQLHNQHV